MHGSLLLRGLIIGLAIAAPVGPIGVLCIRQALRQGFGPAFLSGLGAATADGLYGCVAGFGLTALADFLRRQQFWIALLGGTLLCLLGLRTFRAEPAAATATPLRGGFAAYGTTLLLTLSNPATLLSFAAIFAAFGPGAVAGYDRALRLVGGLFLGSALWWLVLAGGVSLARVKASARMLRILNYLCGALLFGFGAAALARAVALR